MIITVLIDTKLAQYVDNYSFCFTSPSYFTFVVPPGCHFGKLTSRRDDYAATACRLGGIGGDCSPIKRRDSRANVTKIMSTTVALASKVYIVREHVL